MNFFVSLSVALILIAVGYTAGRVDGSKVGYTLAVSEQAAREDENTRIMRKVGICKWAQIMAEDNRCKQELP